MSGMHSPLQVQVFGVRKDADTRKALRFFAERRIRTHFADLDVRPASVGELRRFAQRFGVEALLDRGGRRFADLGLGAAQYGEARWLDRLAQEPLLLRMPLVRASQRLSIGPAEDEWRAWIADRR
jgi:arsenate reductase-like glutaredoxin family protein